jgi:hypothetical protein
MKVGHTFRAPSLLARSAATREKGPAFGGMIMDRFTGRRRATWQSKAPLWPFTISAFVVVFLLCLAASIFAVGVLLGDGTAGGRAIVWFKMLSNVLVPAIVIGLAAGFLLHQLFLAPAGRGGALMWTGLFILTGAFAGLPANIVRGYTADRLGYAMKLDASVEEARTASRRSEREFYRRLGILMHSNPFDPARLAAEDGLEGAGRVIVVHRDLVAEARRNYAPGQVEARAALARAIVDEMDREAVLERFDGAAPARKALVERIWAAHDRIADLRADELQALSSNRGAWRKAPGGVTITSESLFSRVTGLERRIREARGDASAAEAELYRLDSETDAGIDRVLAAAV